MTEERGMTKEERDIERLREMGVDAGRIPDEDLPKGRTRIIFFGEVAKRVPEVGERVEVRVEDGSWRGGYRALTGPVDAREVSEEHLKAAGVDPRGGGSIVWITDEERWTAAAEANRSPDGMPWPVVQLRVESSSEAVGAGRTSPGAGAGEES